MKKRIRRFRLIMAALMSVMLIMNSAGFTAFANEFTQEPDAVAAQVNEETAEGDESTSDQEISSGNEKA